MPSFSNKLSSTGSSATVLQLIKSAEELKDKVPDLLTGNAELWVPWENIQNLYRKILLTDLELALDKKIEQDLWNFVFKNQISAMQNRLRDRRVSGSKRNEINFTLSVFLETAAGFYFQLIQQICTTFKLDLQPHRDAKFYGVSTIKRNGGRSTKEPSLASCLYICQHCLVHLGDVTRYRGGDEHEAETYYMHAAKLVPTNGQPYNQLAIIASNQDNKLSTIFYYIRSICVKHPFAAAQTNLENLFKKLAVEKLDLKGKLSSTETTSVFLQYHACLYTAKAPERLRVLSSKFLTALHQHLVGGLLSGLQLLQMVTINIYSLFNLSRRRKQFTKSQSGNTAADGVTNNEYEEDQPDHFDEDKPSVAALETQAFNFSISFIEQLMQSVPKQTSDESVVGSSVALPAIRITLNWLSLDKNNFAKSVLKSSSLWSHFAKLLNSYQPSNGPFELSKTAQTCSMVALSEDQLLRAYVPLDNYLNRLEFEKTSYKSLALDIENELRKFRLIKLGRWIAESFESEKFFTVKVEENGRLNFSAAAPVRVVKIADSVETFEPSHKNVALMTIKSLNQQQPTVGPHGPQSAGDASRMQDVATEPPSMLRRSQMLTRSLPQSMLKPHVENVMEATCQDTNQLVGQLGSADTQGQPLAQPFDLTQSADSSGIVRMSKEQLGMLYRPPSLRPGSHGPVGNTKPKPNLPPRLQKQLEQIQQQQQQDEASSLEKHQQQQGNRPDVSLFASWPKTNFDWSQMYGKDSAKQHSLDQSQPRKAYREQDFPPLVPTTTSSASGHSINDQQQKLSASQAQQPSSYQMPESPSSRPWSSGSPPLMQQSSSQQAPMHPNQAVGGYPPFGHHPAAFGGQFPQGGGMPPQPFWPPPPHPSMMPYPLPGMMVRHAQSPNGDGDMPPFVPRVPPPHHLSQRFPPPPRPTQSTSPDEQQPQQSEQHGQQQQQCYPRPLPPHGPPYMYGPYGMMPPPPPHHPASAFWMPPPFYGGNGPPAQANVPPSITSKDRSVPTSTFSGQPTTTRATCADDFNTHVRQQKAGVKTVAARQKVKGSSTATVSEKLCDTVASTSDYFPASNTEAYADISSNMDRSTHSKHPAPDFIPSFIRPSYPPSSAVTVPSSAGVVGADNSSISVSQQMTISTNSPGKKASESANSANNKDQAGNEDTSGISFGWFDGIWSAPPEGSLSPFISPGGAKSPNNTSTDSSSRDASVARAPSPNILTAESTLELKSLWSTASVWDNESGTPPSTTGQS